MLNINSLSYSFGSNKQQARLFHDLNLSVEAGEHVVIVGESGGGKSTLLKLIAEQKSPSIQVPETCRTAMVLQQGALLDHLNVIDNLKLVARYNRQALNSDHLGALLSSLNIDTALHKSPISQLSGGQQRRVAIARALVVEPELMLFDEPDAGLDLINLKSLASSVNRLAGQNRACLTVSHNPIYISQVAHKVYRLQTGKLELVAEWQELPQDEHEQQSRQIELQQILSEEQGIKTAAGRVKSPREWVFIKWWQGCVSNLASIVHWSRSLIDELKIAGYVFYLSFISGILFFALVGLMLGSTTIAVVKLLADNALTGLISIFIQPEDLLDMMGGIHVLYLAPAIGGMLFAARSGSIMSNWLGEMVRGKQVQALSYLDVSPKQLLRAPSLIAVAIAMWLTILWFAICVWAGGVVTAEQLFKVSDGASTLNIHPLDIKRSYFWLKTIVYSGIVSLTIVALGLAQKNTAHQVNMHTTKAIIYSTISIALAELLIILS